MQGTEMVVVIVAMSLGYSLLKHIFTPREVKLRRVGATPRQKKWKERVVYEPQPEMESIMENNDELRTRADEMLRRLATLEEIMTSERHAERSQS